MAKEFPYINRFTGDLKVCTKKEGMKLNEDWSRAKMATNEKGDKVFRFEISTPVIDKNGNTRMGVAVVDIQEAKTIEVSDGDTRSS